jgi:nitrile hydratase beta subunit
MDGIHDMGGMHGFGPVPYAKDDPPYHEDWERRVFGMTLAATGPEWMNLDYSRHSLERIPPDVYLSSTYYERWLYGLIMRQVEAGQLTMEELAAGRADPALPRRSDAIPPEAIDAYQNLPFRKDVDAPPRFAVGDAVAMGNPQTKGHTRLPRYARNKRGSIHLHHGAQVLPDTNAHGRGECPTHLYTVKFSARELWGPDASPADHLYVDVWECHLEPAE